MNALEPATDPTRSRSRRRRVAMWVAVGACALLPFAAAACGGGSKDKTATTADANALPDDLGDIVDLTGKKQVDIEVPDNSFKPRAFKVSPGTEIKFTNTGANAHNVTPNDESSFQAVALAPGIGATVTAPAKPGTYRFYCTIHGSKSSGQRGAFVVVP